MKKCRFLWSAHRITERQKAGKSRSIKGKQLKNSRNTVSKQLVELLSSLNDNSTEYQKNIKTLGNSVFSRVFFMSECLQKVVKIGRFFTVAYNSGVRWPREKCDISQMMSLHIFYHYVWMSILQKI